MKNTYTYIFEFFGGTYITQVISSSLEASMHDWVQKIHEEQKEIPHLGVKTLEEIKIQLLSKESDERPVLLNGLVNVWSLCVRTKKGVGMINVVKTVTE